MATCGKGAELQKAPHLAKLPQELTKATEMSAINFVTIDFSTDDEAGTEYDDDEGDKAQVLYWVRPRTTTSPRPGGRGREQGQCSLLGGCVPPVGSQGQGQGPPHSGQG